VSAGQVYNIGGGPDRTISVWKEFGPLLEEVLGRKIPATFQDWRPGDQKVFVSDIRRAASAFDWMPKVDVVQGVRRLVEWVQENRGLFNQ
jgi:CDP-paratose 2-epimerase